MQPSGKRNCRDVPCGVRRGARLEHDEVAERFARYRSDELLNVAVLPRRAWRRDDFRAPDRLPPAAEVPAIRDIAIAKQVVRTGVSPGPRSIDALNCIGSPSVASHIVTREAMLSADISISCLNEIDIRTDARFPGFGCRESGTVVRTRPGPQKLLGPHDRSDMEQTRTRAMVSHP